VTEWLGSGLSWAYLRSDVPEPARTAPDLVDFGIAETGGDTRIAMAWQPYWLLRLYGAGTVQRRKSRTRCGCVLASMCALRIADRTDTVPAQSMEQLIAAHISSPPPRPSALNPKVPASFDDVIARGMAKESDDRYATAGALGRAAQRALKAGEQLPHNAATMAAGYGAVSAP
jgi:hypothetical protein